MSENNSSLSHARSLIVHTKRRASEISNEEPGLQQNIERHENGDDDTFIETSPWVSTMSHYVTLGHNIHRPTYAAGPILNYPNLDLSKETRTSLVVRLDGTMDLSDGWLPKTFKVVHIDRCLSLINSKSVVFPNVVSLTVHNGKHRIDSRWFPNLIGVKAYLYGGVPKSVKYVELGGRDAWPFQIRCLMKNCPGIQAISGCVKSCCPRICNAYHDILKEHPTLEWIDHSCSLITPVLEERLRDPLILCVDIVGADIARIIGMYRVARTPWQYARFLTQVE